MKDKAVWKRKTDVSTQVPCVEGAVCEGLRLAWTYSCTDPPLWCDGQGHADGFTHKDAEPACVPGFVPGAGYSKTGQGLDPLETFMALGEGGAHFEPSDPTNTYSLHLSH